MVDETEDIRRGMVLVNNQSAGGRETLEARYPQLWNTEQLAQDFEVLGFMAPFVVVKRKADGKKGSLEFQHHPRFYFNFKED